MTKVCPCCKEEKLLNEFNSQGKYCKVCHSLKGKLWRTNNKEKNDISQHKYHLTKAFSETKICNKCKVEKPIDEFPKKKTTYSCKCKECQKVYSQEHYKNNKAEYLTRNSEKKISLRAWYLDYKFELFCIVCGETESVCLDFHHKDPNEKESNVAYMISNGYSLDKIKSEISKCVVVCSNCHRKLHSKLIELA